MREELTFREIMIMLRILDPVFDAFICSILWGTITALMISMLMYILLFAGVM
jgi:hypothetical protein